MQLIACGVRGVSAAFADYSFRIVSEPAFATFGLALQSEVLAKDWLLIAQHHLLKEVVLGFQQLTSFFNPNFFGKLRDTIVNFHVAIGTKENAFINFLTNFFPRSCQSLH